MQEWLEKVVNWLTTEGLKLLICLILLFISFWIVNGIAKRVKRRMEKRGKDKTVTSLMFKVIRIGGKLALFVIFLGVVGFDTAGIGTIIASFGVAIGLALQGALSNLAGGIIILIMRPLRIGDFIEAQGVSGTVEDIHIFYTDLVTPDNKMIHLPNGSLANGSITNYSKKSTRRVDMEFTISYDDDFVRAEKIIGDLCAADGRIMTDPAPFIRVKSHGDSAVVIVMRVWSKSEDYWAIYFDMMENVKKQFDANNI